MQPIDIKTIRPIVDQFPNVQLVYLFGSQVSGHKGPTSDYDFALYIDDDKHGPSIRAAFAHAVNKLLIDIGVASAPVPPDLVDVVLLNRAPIELAYSVISTGQLLYRQDESSQVEYEAGVLLRYGDYLPVLRFFRQAAKQGYSSVTNHQRYRTALARTERTLAQIRAAGGKK